MQIFLSPGKGIKFRLGQLKNWLARLISYCLLPISGAGRDWHTPLPIDEGMMKISLVGNYPPPFGGISVHVQLLQRALLREGIDCQVLNVDPRANAGSDYIHS